MDIRPLKAEDLAKLKELVEGRAEGIVLPKGFTLIGFFKDGELEAVCGVGRPIVLDYMVSKNPVATERLIAWLDGKTYPEAYYSFVSNERLSQGIQHKYGDAVEMFDGKLLIRRR